MQKILNRKFGGALWTSALLVSGFLALKAPAAMLGNVETWEKEGNTVVFHCGGPVVELQFRAVDVVQVRMSPDEKFKHRSRHNEQMVLRDCYKNPPAIKVKNAEAVEIATERLVIRVDKTPFRLHFLQSDGQTPITRNPRGKTLDTDLTVYFEPDVAVQTERLFGAGEKAGRSCELRGKSFVCYDHWGHGAPAPWFMSTAGYGIFVNSLLGSQIKFNLAEKSENFSLSVGSIRKSVPYHVTSKTAEDLEFFFIYGPSFQHMIDSLTTLTGKPPIFPKPIFGLSYHTRSGKDQQKPGGFTRFRKEGYPIDGCITFINRSWNKKSDDYVRKISEEIHEMHGWVVGYLDSTDSYVGFLMDTDYPYRNWHYYREHLMARLFRNRVDSIYMDELESRGSMFALRCLNATYDTMAKAYPGRRPVVLTRSGYSGCQRYAYWWMGDTGDHAHSADMVVATQLAHGLSGLPHTTHDLGGYFGPGSKEGCIRGAQMNFLQPMAHLNVYRGKGEPWHWGPEAEKIFMRFDKLHYRLLPYWYTCAWQAHETGMPAWRHLAFTDSKYYARDNEFMIGDWFYFAPILNNGNSRPVFIPDGRWIDYFTGKVFEGPREIESYQVPLERTALFVKAGAIIPMGPEIRYVGEKPLAPLTLDLYPYGCKRSTYTIYEDDGVTTKYLKGEYCTTNVEMDDTGKSIVVIIHARQGPFEPPKRNIKVLLHGIEQRPERVSLNGKAVDAQYDPATETLRTSFPDTEREQRLVVTR